MNASVTRVKICGITNREDAEEAIAAGADAIGFNVWKGSKRCIDLATAAEWIRELPPFVGKVAVAVNPTDEEAAELSRIPFIHAVQLHGDETPEWCRAFSAHGKPFVKALGVASPEHLEIARSFGTSNVLLDAYAPGVYGGTGRQIDWSLAARFIRENPDLRVILSGGLNPANVAEAVRIVRPFAVDVASGVEEEPRRKDARKMRELISSVRFAI